MHTKDYALECLDGHEDTHGIPQTQSSTPVSTLIVTERPEIAVPETFISENMYSDASWCFLFHLKVSKAMSPSSCPYKY